MDLDFNREVTRDHRKDYGTKIESVVDVSKEHLPVCLNQGILSV
jgi:hypothetical protein